MKIKDLAAKTIKFSLILVIIGMIIFLIGYSLNGFKFNEKPVEEYKWYEVIRI